MNHRRRFLLVGLSASASLASGCVTKELLEIGPANYSEEISAFLMTSEGDKLVVLGKSYHYIFSAPPELKALLSSSLRQLVRAEFSAFQVDSDATIRGRLELIAETLGADDRAKALTLGFRSQNSGDRLVLQRVLTGTRYSADGFDRRAIATRFNRTYRVQVTEPGRPGIDYIPKLLLTPLSIGLDGVVILATAILMPLALPMAFGHGLPVH